MTERVISNQITKDIPVIYYISWKGNHTNKKTKCMGKQSSCWMEVQYATFVILHCVKMKWLIQMKLIFNAKRPYILQPLNINTLMIWLKCGAGKCKWTGQYLVHSVFRLPLPFHAFWISGKENIPLFVSNALWFRVLTWYQRYCTRSQAYILCPVWPMTRGRNGRADDMWLLSGEKKQELQKSLSVSVLLSHTLT